MYISGNAKFFGGWGWGQVPLTNQMGKAGLVALPFASANNVIVSDPYDTHKLRGARKRSERTKKLSYR